MRLVERQIAQPLAEGDPRVVEPGQIDGGHLKLLPVAGQAQGDDRGKPGDRLHVNVTALAHDFAAAVTDGPADELAQEGHEKPPRSLPEARRWYRCAGSGGAGTGRLCSRRASGAGAG